MRLNCIGKSSLQTSMLHARPWESHKRWELETKRHFLLGKSRGEDELLGSAHTSDTSPPWKARVIHKNSLAGVYEIVRNLSYATLPALLSTYYLWLHWKAKVMSCDICICFWGVSPCREWWLVLGSLYATSPCSGRITVRHTYSSNALYRKRITCNIPQDLKLLCKQEPQPKHRT